MSIDRDYYLIAGYDLTAYKTDKYDDWCWTNDGERYRAYQKKGYIQFFDDPMGGYYLYFGYVLASGNEYDFPTVKIDAKESARVEYDVREALRYLKEIGVIDGAADEAAYNLIFFEECT